MDAVFSHYVHAVTVAETEYIHPDLRRVCFTGDFQRIDFKVTQAVAFRVTDTHYRNYTPVTFDAVNGQCSVYFYLHAGGPGSRFARQLQVGDTVKMVEPRGRSLYRADSKYHFFFGDETSLGLFSSLTHEVHANNQEYFGVLELRDTCSALPEQAGLMLDIVPRSEIPAANAIHYIDTLHERVWQVWHTAVFYLTGNAHSIKAFRKALLGRGVAEKNIVVQPYWAEGKEGL